MLIKWSLCDTIHDSISNYGNAKDFIDAINEKFKIS